MKKHSTGMAENALFQVSSKGGQEVNVKEVLARYLRRWYLFILGIILCVGVAYLHLRYNAVPQYQISSKLLIKDSENSSGLSGMESFSDMGIFKSTRSIENEIEVLKNSGLMERVLNRLSLRVSYFIKGKVHDVEVYGEDIAVKVMINEAEPLSYGKPVTIHILNNNSFQLIEEDANGEKSISEHKFGQEIRKPYGTFTIVANADISSDKNFKDIIFRFHNLEQLAERYSAKLMVKPVYKNGSILDISLVDAIPKKGQDIINMLVEVYNEEAIEDKNRLAVNTIELIDERMKHLTTELTNVEKDVERYKQRNDLTDVSSDAQLYLQRASEYNRQSAELEIQIDILNSIENYLKKQGDELELVPSSLNIQDPTLAGLIAKFNELQMERQRMLRTISKSNPLVLDMDEQLFNLRTNILENLRNIKDGLAITQKNLRASSSKFESRIQKVPSIERELLEISRQQSIKEGLYLYLLQKREEAALSLVAAVSNTRVIGPAKAGRFPVSPNKTTIYLVAVLLGLGLPFAGIFLKDSLNDKVEMLRDVTQATNTPILGEISHHDIKQAMVVTGKSRTPVAELFRLIRSNLRFASAGKENKVILITSSMSGEGKTFFSINLGASLALIGKRVVILGFDLRKPRLMQDLRLSNQLGISNYLISPNMPVDKILVPSPIINGLYLVDSGPIPPNPGELMMSTKVNELIEELRGRFDYVIVDTAPVGQVADAFALSHLVDSSIYLARYGFTSKGQIEIIDDIYRNQKLKYPMIVMNGAKKKNGYGYGYGYGVGYGADPEKEKRKKVVS